MVQYGNQTSVYMQKGLLPRVVLIIAKNPDIFKSRNHFLNCAIIREMRRYNTNGKLHKPEETSKEGNP